MEPLLINNFMYLREFNGPCQILRSSRHFTKRGVTTLKFENFYRWCNISQAVVIVVLLLSSLCDLLTQLNPGMVILIFDCLHFVYGDNPNAKSFMFEVALCFKNDRSHSMYSSINFNPRMSFLRY